MTFWNKIINNVIFFGRTNYCDIYAFMHTKLVLKQTPSFLTRCIQRQKNVNYVSGNVNVLY